MHRLSILLLTMACKGPEAGAPTTAKPEPVVTPSEDDPPADDDSDAPRDIPPQDSGTSEDDTAAPEATDTATPSTDTADPPTIEVDIDTGRRWIGQFIPSLMFGEIRWETANLDGSRCLIEGLMADIVEREESCWECDFGLQFTLTGLVILLDEGACDSAMLALEGSTMEFGHGYTQSHTAVGSDLFDLYRLVEGEWETVENGFSSVESGDDYSDAIWIFGEELSADGETEDVPDADAPDSP